MAAPGHAVALLLALWAAAAAAQDTFTADTPVVKEQKVLDGAAFPARRPPLWPFRTLDTASVATCERKGPYGWKLTIKHKDLKGITEPMMVWLFANLASGTSVRARGAAPARAWGAGAGRKPRARGRGGRPRRPAAGAGAAAVSMGVERRAGAAEGRRASAGRGRPGACALPRAPPGTQPRAACPARAFRAPPPPSPTPPPHAPPPPPSHAPLRPSPAPRPPSYPPPLPPPNPQTHPTDGQKYPNFLLYHPRDHILHTRTDDKDAFRKGRQNRFVEFPLTGEECSAGVCRGRVLHQSKERRGSRGGGRCLLPKGPASGARRLHAAPPRPSPRPPAGCRRKAPDSFEFDCPKAPDANPGWLSTSNTTWTMLEQTNGAVWGGAGGRGQAGAGWNGRGPAGLKRGAAAAAGAHPLQGRAAGADAPSPPPVAFCL
jgi:hypothetical protein